MTSPPNTGSALKRVGTPTAQGGKVTEGDANGTRRAGGTTCRPPKHSTVGECVSAPISTKDASSKSGTSWSDIAVPTPEDVDIGFVDGGGHAFMRSESAGPVNSDAFVRCSTPSPIATNT
jgi:hypothetical protein